jgi:hypothetical protein
MYRPKNQFIGTALLLFAGACQVLNTQNVPATLQAQNADYIVEATRMAESLAQREFDLFVTAQAASTTIADMSNVNRQLAATAQAVIPPTPVRQVSVASGVEGSPDSVSGIQFGDTGATTNKRDSDGCADGFQTGFAPDTQRIYVITRAITVTAGTVVSIDWMSAGQMVGEGSYTVAEDQFNFCIWFPYDGPFAPGEWSAQLFVNGEPIQPAINFTVGSAMSDSG